MSGMDGTVLFAGLGLLLALCGVLTAVAIMKAPARPHPRRATRYERVKNQSDVEEWIGRAKGEDHVRRMRGDV